MRAPIVDEDFVAAAAAAVDLPISAQHLAGVTGNLQRIAELAAPVLAVPLSPEDEAAPVWRPQ